MSRSEIFDNYAKIALEKGIIKKAEETNPRFDSRSVKDIANLYNVKNEKPADMEYKKNIVEDAHPEPVVFFQSHDKINSLVENVNERQNIIINILQKMPNGNLTQKKYANELTLSLIRVATDMDNKNQEELRVLADTCAEQLQKKAIAPLVVAGIAAVAVAGGLIYYKNHSDYKNEGVVRNGENLISQLEDVITSGTGTWSTRSEYRDELKDQLKLVQSEVQKVINTYQKMSMVIDAIEAPKTQDQLEHIIHTAKWVSSKPAITSLYNDFKKIVTNMEPMLNQLLKNFKSESYKNKEIKEEGLGGKINDFFGGVFYGGKGFISDEFDDVVHAINPFRTSIKETLDTIAQAESAEKDAAKKIQQAQQTAAFYDSVKQPEAGPMGSPTAPGAPTETAVNFTGMPGGPSTLDALDKDISELTNAFSGGKSPFGQSI